MTDTPAAPTTATGTAAAAAPGLETMPVTAAEAAASAAAAAAALAAAAPKPAITREAAKAELDRLKGSAEFRGKLLSGDAAAKAQWTELIRNSTQAPTATDEAAKTKALAGGISLLQATGIDVSSDAGKDLVGILAGKPIAIEVRRAAETRRAAIMKDQAFIAKWASGDAEARRTLTTLNTLLVAKVEG
jgi:hypothetical protein